MDPGTSPDSFAESFVKLRYTPGVSGVDNGKPRFEVADYWGAFSDFGRADEDQDLGAAGVFIIPERGNLIGGGKDGILYNLDKNNLGKDTWNPHFNLPFVATYLPNPPTSGTGLPTTTVTNPNWPIVNRDRNLPAQTPAGKSHHIHGTPVYMERAAAGIVFLWGENERLKGYNFNFATKRITSFRAQGTQIASGNMAAPGGMPGGRLVVSSNGTTPGTAVVWGVYPTEGNANSAVVHGALVAYDATTVLNGNRLKQLFHSDTDPANSMGNFAKYSTPVVANGKVYVGTFSNKVVQYGLAPGLRIAKPAGAEAASAAPAAARTASTTSSLSDLGAMTFGCPAAALNAAAREASKVLSRGSYQFSSFRTHSDSHHGSYKVHFKSNYQGEPDLKYCVAIYCQQGWDPATTKTSVTLMGTRSQSAARCRPRRRMQREAGGGKRPRTRLKTIRTSRCGEGFARHDLVSSIEPRRRSARTPIDAQHACVEVRPQRSCAIVLFSKSNVAIRSHEIDGITLEPGATALLSPREHVQRKRPLLADRLHLARGVTVHMDLPVERCQRRKVVAAIQRRGDPRQPVATVHASRASFTEPTAPIVDRCL